MLINPYMFGNNGLLVYYPFNGNANDESGNGNNGTVYGATLTTDRKSAANSAYAFNGSAYIDFSPPVVTAFSISVWVKRVPGTYSYQGIVAFTNGTARREIFTAGGDKINILYGANKYRMTNDVIISDGTWKHIVLTYDGASASVYLNNILQTLGTESTAGGGPSDKAWIGQVINTSYRFTGSIDDVRIYNRALTTEEITTLYNE